MEGKSVYVAFNSPPGMKFVIVNYRFTNMSGINQTTPYVGDVELKETGGEHFVIHTGGMLVTRSGKRYEFWIPSRGFSSTEYAPRVASEYEAKKYGVSTAFKSLARGESVTGQFSFMICQD